MIKKRTNVHNILYLLIILLTMSCTEVIDVDLNTSNAQIVIEGSMPSDDVLPMIRITKSISFDESNDFPSVENAFVSLSDNYGNSAVLFEVSTGIYSTNDLKGEEGVSYTLTVEVDNQTLTSTSTIPSKISFDELIVKESLGGGGPGHGGVGKEETYDVFVKYQDPVGTGNYYRFVEYINGALQGSYVFDDRLSDGLENERNLLSFDRDVAIGDTIKIEMHCIDQAVFEYFNSFGVLMGGPANASTPANPNTNITGSDLGYFSAHTVEVKEIVVE